MTEPLAPPTLLDQIVRRVAELPDRTSPDDWPEAMLVTVAELRAILTELLTAQPVTSSRDNAAFIADLRREADELETSGAVKIGPVYREIATRLESLAR